MALSAGLSVRRAQPAVVSAVLISRWTTFVHRYSSSDGGMLVESPVGASGRSSACQWLGLFRPRGLSTTF